MAILFGHVDPSLHGRAVGFYLACGGIGWMTIPALIGVYARRRGVQRAFLIALAVDIGLAVIAVVLAAAVPA